MRPLGDDGLLAAAGVSLPRRLAIVGFDDGEHARHARPTLSTVAQDFRGIGRRAAELAIAQLRGETYATDAQAVEAALDLLLTRGTGFAVDLRTQSGRTVEAQGRTVAGRAMLRLRETTAERREIADLRITLDEARRGLSALAGLLDAIPQPVWRRNREGGLSWVNAAYAAAVEAETREAALDGGVDILLGDFMADDAPARIEQALGVK